MTEPSPPPLLLRFNLTINFTSVKYLTSFECDGPERSLKHVPCLFFAFDYRCFSLRCFLGLLFPRTPVNGVQQFGEQHRTQNIMIKKCSKTGGCGGVPPSGCLWYSSKTKCRCQLKVVSAGLNYSLVATKNY